MRYEQLKEAEVEFIPKRKKEPVSWENPENIKELIVRLKKHESGKMTKIANNFTRAKELKEELNHLEQQWKDDVKAVADDMFGAGNEIYTRVIDTASLTFKISKSEERQVEKMDQMGYLAELERLTGLNAEALAALKKQFTTVEPRKTPPRVGTPKFKVESNELSEGPVDSIKAAFSKLLSKIKSYLPKWDKSFKKLEAGIESIL